MCDEYDSDEIDKVYLAAQAMLAALKLAQAAWFQGNPATMQAIRDAIKQGEDAHVENYWPLTDEEKEDNDV